MKSAKWWMSFAGALWFAVGCALGATETVDGIEWEYYDDGNLYGPTDKSLSGDVVLPSVLGVTPITAIWWSAFGSCTNLTSVTIPDGIMSIGNSAFDNCSSLTSVMIPDSVTDIGGYAFYGCTGLTNVTFGSGVTNIGMEAFSECINLYDTNSLPGVCLVNGWVVGWNDGLSGDVDLTGIRGIAGGAFSECGSLMNVTIPDSATVIGEMSFSGCSSLTTVTIGDGVTDIGRDAFYNCSSLESVTIGDSVTHIGDGAFYNCSSLTSVTIPDSVTSIGDNAFYGCSGDGESVPGVYLVDGWVVGCGFGPCGDLDLTGIRGIADRVFYNCSCLESVTIPEGVTHIGAYAFAECSVLTNVTMPSGLVGIGEEAFFNCASLPSVTIPDSVTNIGYMAFYDCTNLTAVYIHDLAAWCEIEFEEADANPLYYAHHLYLNGEEVMGNLAIPDGTTSIGSAAFYGCSGLTNVTIPNSVTSIGYNAFSGCSNLTSVTIPDGVTSLYAFSGCSGLTNVTLPDSITSIGGFSGCSGLTNITIPDSVTNIGWRAFSGCSGLTDVTIPDGVTSIGNEAFSNCWSLTSVTIPESVTRLGNAAFSGCGRLANVTILGNIGNNWSYSLWANVKPANPSPFYPSGLKTLVLGGEMTHIGNAMFYRCGGLTNVTIQDGVTSIGDSAFYKCYGLSNVTIPDSVTSIGMEAFYDCSGLESVTIGNNVTNIGVYAFRFCSGLTNMRIPGSVTRIGSLAFAGCRLMESFSVADENPAYKSVSGLLLTKDGKTLIAGVNGDVVVPDGVTNIGGYAFSGHHSLTSVTIPDSVVTIGSDAFYSCGLTSVTIPDSVTSIGEDAFWYCGDLTSVTIGNGVSDIGNYAFGYCSNLTSVAIGNSVTNVRFTAFYGCSRLQTLYVPASWEGSGMLTNAGIPSSCTIVYRKSAQSVAFDPIGPQTAAGRVELGATAAGGGTVAFEVVSGPGVLEGNELVFTGTGTVVVRATAEGSVDWEAGEATREIVAVEAGATAPIAAAEYEQWVREAGLDGGNSPQSIRGANGHENWVNYLWDVPPTSTNTLDMEEVEVDAQGNVVFRVGAASTRRWYSLQVWKELGGEPEVIDLGRGESGMGVTNAMQGTEWFGGLTVRTTE